MSIDNLSKDIFRAYDIRGIVGEQIDEQIMTKIGMAIGSEAVAKGCDSIVIARDGRLSGPGLFAALSMGLLQSGLNVIDIGCVPTPVLYFATYFYKTGCGAMLTGSHNPSNYNGVKMMIAGKTISGEEITKLYTRIVNNDFVLKPGSLQANVIVQDYINEVCSRIKLKKKLKIVVDTGNGVAGVITKKLFTALGCEVKSLYEKIDGTFPNHHPDPSKEENLEDLRTAVLGYKADIGLAFDGDGDRLGVVTNAGKIIMPDRQLMLWARSLLIQNPGAVIVFDVKCSSHLAKFIEMHNGKPVMCKTGHSYIKNKMLETEALLGGEMSGHIFFKERWYGFDDALYAGARLLEILANDYPEQTAHELFNNLPDSVNTAEINLSIADDKKFAFIEDLKRLNEFNNPDRIVDIDGLRVEYSDGWGLVRASNTTPSLVLRFEADNQIALDRIMQEFHNIISSRDPGLKLL